ncbi:MAG: hypothetical protein F4018_13010 [Acidobacteria bacterium]|nr:hypothetical protein [Chloroflexota bacterium]MYK89172.1 hypothetical protein [Acidobacteriota bacterium]
MTTRSQRQAQPGDKDFATRADLARLQGAVESRLGNVERDVATLKKDVKALKGDTEQILDILTGSRP